MNCRLDPPIDLVSSTKVQHNTIMRKGRRDSQWDMVAVAGGGIYVT